MRFADPLERLQSVAVHHRLEFFCFLAEFVFLLSCLWDDLIEFLTFLLQNVAVVFEQSLVGLYVGMLLGNAFIGLADVLFGKFHLEALVFLLLLEECVLAVVAYVVDLLLVLGDLHFPVLDLSGFGLDEFVEFLEFFLVFGDTGFVTGDFILAVFYLVWEFAAENPDAVNPRKGMTGACRGL